MEYVDRTVTDPHCLDPNAKGGPQRRRALESFRGAVYGGVQENEGKSEAWGLINLFCRTL